MPRPNVTTVVLQMTFLNLMHFDSNIQKGPINDEPALVKLIVWRWSEPTIIKFDGISLRTQNIRIRYMTKFCYIWHKSAFHPIFLL